MPAVLVTGPTATQNLPFRPQVWPEDHRQYSFRLPTKGWPGWVATIKLVQKRMTHGQISCSKFLIRASSTRKMDCVTVHLGDRKQVFHSPRCDRYWRICFTADPSRPGLSRWYGTLAMTVARHFSTCVITTAKDSDDKTINRHRWTALTIRPTTTDNGVKDVMRYWSLKQNTSILYK